MHHEQWQAVNAAFSKQSHHFDQDDYENPILPWWRRRIHYHVQKFLKPNSTILELNAGTGIDAFYFAKKGHRVHVTDLSDGMISQLHQKTKTESLEYQVSVQQVSFENLNEVQGKYDFIFSNFGGLNCTKDLEKVTRHFTALLKPNSLVTLVIMPPFCLWEILWILKGDFKKAMRRFDLRGADSNLEGIQFKTYYYSLHQVRKAMGNKFALVKSESLGWISPPPASTKFITRFPRITAFLNKIDRGFAKLFPFNRIGDHLIITFRLK